jgi:hypothetical protein
MKMSLKSVLQNKYVCYLVLFISIMNILGYLAIQDFDSVVVFVAIGLLSSYFSKNMIIILGSALIGTNMIYASNKIHEGLKNKKKKKEKFGQRNVPKSRPAKVDDDDDETDVGRIDQAATMEQAYDNLNKMLGKGGIGNLTKDTQGLMNQQKDLMNQLKDFQPMMKQAGDMLDKLGGMDNLNGIMGKLGGISGLTGGKKK